MRGQAALDAIPLGPSSPGITRAEQASLNGYTRPENFLTINGALRGEVKHAGRPPDARSARDTKNIDNVMGRSRTTDNVEVWRGMQGGSDELFGTGRMAGNMTGLEWEEKGFLSTSVRMTAAREFTQSSNAVLMRIRARKGTGAAKMVNRERDGEGEVLLQRGLKMRVTADYGINPDWGYRALDIEVFQ